MFYKGTSYTVADPENFHKGQVYTFPASQRGRGEDPKMVLKWPFLLKYSTKGGCDPLNTPIDPPLARLLETCYWLKSICPLPIERMILSFSFIKFTLMNTDYHCNFHLSDAIKLINQL